MFTIRDFAEIFLSICSGISIVAVAFGWIYKGIKKVKAPSDKIHATLKEHENRMDEQDKRIEEIEINRSKDRKIIDELIEGNKVIQKSLLAIMEQLLSNGTEKKPLEDAKKELQDYLVNK